MRGMYVRDNRYIRYRNASLKGLFDQVEYLIPLPQSAGETRLETRQTVIAAPSHEWGCCSWLWHFE